jgi:hypothetical protein
VKNLVMAGAGRSGVGEVGARVVAVEKMVEVVHSACLMQFPTGGKMAEVARCTLGVVPRKGEDGDPLLSSTPLFNSSPLCMRELRDFQIP